MNHEQELDTDLVAAVRQIFTDQVQRTVARRIRAKVRDARGDPDRAAQRWPFELIQNAHDAGPRVDADRIAVSFEFAEGTLRFEHDAAPFTLTDITALLTGGSSKDFDSEDTTGRFGTGFLVTHALSERVEVGGVLEAERELRAFGVTLDRPDDEDLIHRNIEESQLALGRTTPVNNFSERSTATLRYAVDDAATATAGLNTLEESLPHLFGSCRRLREVTLRRETTTTTWWTSEPAGEPVERNGVWVDEIGVTARSDTREERHWRVLRARKLPESKGWLLACVREVDGQWTVDAPGRIPSVFRQLPVIGGPKLPAWFVLDGEFDLDQERSSIHVVGDMGRPLHDAVSALGGLALLAVDEGWTNGFRVAHIDMPTDVQGEAAEAVWQETLSATAETLSSLPLVHSVRHGILPAVARDDYDQYVDFLQRDASGVSHADLWNLAARCTNTDPPLEVESEGWSEIAEGWANLGVDIELLDLEDLGAAASEDAESLPELAVEGDPTEWLSGYLELVGKAWDATGITKSHVDRLLPDQHGMLRGFDELRRDGGVSDRVKDIAASVGLDLRTTLLDESLPQALEDQGLENGLIALGDAVGRPLTEAEAVNSLVAHLAEALPADQAVREDAGSAAAATIPLLLHLWETGGSSAKESAWGVPLLAADGTARRVAHRRLMVSPVLMWDERAQPFAAAYPPGRVLADEYAAIPDSALLVDALADWGIAHPSLLVTGHREELADRQLRALARDPDEVGASRLKDVTMPQIALLEPEVLNYVKQERARAKALLGLVVRFVASEDTSWRSVAQVTLRAPDGDRQVTITPTLWLADLRSKPWIPVEDEDDLTQHVPHPELLRELIDSAWLENNPEGADLLVRHFEMDALDVRLLAAASDESTRQRLRDGLARIVDVTGHDPQVLEDLAEKVESRQRDVHRMRTLGLAVQDSVRLALERHGLDVALVDHGYDYLVSAVEVREEDGDDLSAYFALGDYKVEIKAASAAEARLTPLQARTAVDSPESFVLCVVDLRSFPESIHDVEWSEVDVGPYCKFVPGGDLPVDDTLVLVRDAEDSDVPIRNSTALRYAVTADMWSDGRDLDDWVLEAFST